MLDKLMERVFGSYKSTVTGLVTSAVQAAAMVYLGGNGTFDNRTFYLTLAPAVIGALQKDGNGVQALRALLPAETKRTRKK